MSKARRKGRLGATAAAHNAKIQSEQAAKAAAAEQERMEAARRSEPPPEVHLAIITNVNDLPQHEVDERALLGLMEDWRNGRADRNIWQALGDAYVAVLATLMIGAMLVSSLIRAQSVAADCTTAECTTGRGLLPWAATFGVLSFTLAAAKMFGPVLASAAEGFWLMEAPVSRRRLLTRRLVNALMIAVVLGAAVGALVAALTGSPGIAVLMWAAAGGLGSAGLVAFAAAEQGAERTWLISVLQTILALAAFAALMLVVGTAAGWISPILNRTATEQLTVIVASLGLLGVVAGGLIAHQRMERMRRARLVSGGSLVSSMQGAAFALDFGLMRDILVTRQANQRGHVRPTRGTTKGLRALVMRDVQRLWRFPRPLFPLVASIVVPYAVQALGLGRLTVPISAIVLLVVLVPFFQTLRVLSRSKGLARTLPFTTGQIRSAACVVPGVLTVLWAILATPAFLGIGGAPMLGKNPTMAAMTTMVTAAAGFIAAIRWVSARPANYQAPMMATEMGAMPPGLMFNLIRGFDMIAIISLPVLLGGSPWISLALAFVCFTILRTGGIDAEELAAMQEENKRLMEEARANAKGGKPGAGKPAASGGATKAPPEKIKVTRTRR